MTPLALPPPAPTTRTTARTTASTADGHCSQHHVAVTTPHISARQGIPLSPARPISVSALHSVHTHAHVSAHPNAQPSVRGQGGHKSAAFTGPVPLVRDMCAPRPPPHRTAQACPWCEIKGFFNIKCSIKVCFENEFTIFRWAMNPVNSRVGPETLKFGQNMPIPRCALTGDAGGLVEECFPSGPDPRPSSPSFGGYESFGSFGWCCFCPPPPPRPR